MRRPATVSGGVLPALVSAAVVADDGPPHPTPAGTAAAAAHHRPDGAWPYVPPAFPSGHHRPDGAWPYVPPAFPNGCLGEFSFCSRSKACVLDSTNASACAVCGAGEYLCPDWRSCAPSAQAYADCPGIAGSHLDPSLPQEARLDALVARTNLSDWVGQMRTNAPAIPKAAVPAYNWLNDDLHGVMGPHATVFPDGCALGASWSRELLWEVGRAVGTEARGAHAGFTHDGDRGSRTEGSSGGYGENGVGITLYGPSVNLVRDPRWGRSQEVYSEDPTLTGQLAVPFVRGTQGAAPNGSALDPRGILLAGSCCKHFVAYDQETIPVDRGYFNADVSTRTFWECYAPAFHDCVAGGEAMHVMTSINSLNGAPTAAEPELLQGLLRKSWGFAGFIVTDFGGFEQIYTMHGCKNPDIDPARCCSNVSCAAIAGMAAGLDQDGGGTACVDEIPALVRAGKIAPARIEQSFRRLMRARLRLGMMDPPTLNDQNRVKFAAVESTAHLRLARRAAAAAICLYRNRNDTLPLDATELNHSGAVLLAGFSADDGDLLQGNYARHTDLGGKAASILAGLTEALSADGSVTFEPGCLSAACPERDFSAAVSAARRSRVAVVVVGTIHSSKNNDDSFAPCGALDVNGVSPTLPIACGMEGHDRSSIALAGNQLALAHALRREATGTPLVCVLVHGGSLALGNLLQDCDALVDAWLPGGQGARGLADTLFGVVSPAGRSPQTFYRDNASLPAPGDMRLYANASRGSAGWTYRYTEAAIDVPFGAGLSYAAFSYSNLRTNTSSMAACDVVSVSVEVTNNGSRDSDEVVQLYVEKSPGESGRSPKLRLADFARVHVRAGQTVAVALQLTPKNMFVVADEDKDSFWEPTMMVEPGPVVVHVGGGQPGFTAARSADR